MYTLRCPDCGYLQGYTGVLQAGVFTFCHNPSLVCQSGGFEIIQNLVVSPPAPHIQSVLNSLTELHREADLNKLSSTGAAKTCDLKTCEIVHVHLAFSEYDYCRTHKIEVNKKDLEPKNEDDTPEWPKGWPSYW